MKKIIYLILFFIIFNFNYSNAAKPEKIGLQELRLNIEGLTPSFEKNIYKYYLTIPEEVQNIEIEAVSENSDIEIDGNKNLKIGLNIITIKVNSEVLYTIEVTKTNNILAANTNLENLAIQNTLLNPPFDSNITQYNIEVANDVTDLNILAIPQNENTIVEINGGKNLNIGENLVEISVIAQNGFSKKIYEINVIRKNNEEQEKTYIAEKTNFEVEKENTNNRLVILVLISIMLLGIIIFLKLLKSRIST